jgi:hypothetical protein
MEIPTIVNPHYNRTLGKQPQRTFNGIYVYWNETPTPTVYPNIQTLVQAFGVSNRTLSRFIKGDTKVMRNAVLPEGLTIQRIVKSNDNNGMFINVINEFRENMDIYSEANPDISYNGKDVVVPQTITNITSDANVYNRNLGYINLDVIDNVNNPNKFDTRILTLPRQFSDGFKVIEFAPGRYTNDHKDSGSIIYTLIDIYNRLYSLLNIKGESTANRKMGVFIQFAEGEEFYFAPRFVLNYEDYFNGDEGLLQTILNFLDSYRIKADTVKKISVITNITDDNNIERLSDQALAQQVEGYGKNDIKINHQSHKRSKKLLEVVGDGLCFFRCIVIHIGKYSDEITKKNSREQTDLAIKMSKDYFDNYEIGVLTPDIIKEICNDYNINIYIKKGFDKVIDFKSESNIVDDSSELYLELKNKHYNILFEKPISKSEEIKKNNELECGKALKVISNNIVKSPSKSKSMVYKNICIWDCETHPHPITKEHIPYLLTVLYVDMKGVVNKLYWFSNENNTIRCFDMFRDWLIETNKNNHKITDKDKDTSLNINCFAHNGGKYDNLFLLKSFLSIDIIPDKKIILQGKRWTYISFANGQIEFRDTCAFLPASLRSLCKTFGVETQKGFFDHKKLHLPNIGDIWKVINEEKDNILEYAMDDVICLNQIWQKYSEYNHETYGVNVLQLYTASQTSQKIFYTNYYNYKDENDAICSLTKNQYEYISRAYFGGRTEVFTTYIDPSIRKNGKFHVNDINSSYPSSCIEDMTSGLGEYFDGADIDINDFWGFIQVDIESPEELYLPVLPHKHQVDDQGDKLIFTNGLKKNYVVWCEELLEAVSEGYKIHNIHNGIGFKKAKLFKNYIEKLYNERLVAKEKGDTFTIQNRKDNMNSFYGKLGQKPVQKNVEFINDSESLMNIYLNERLDVSIPNFITTNDETMSGYAYIQYESKKDNIDIELESSARTIHLAAVILSKSRIKLYRMLKRLHKCGCIIMMCDTDSVYYFQPEGVVIPDDVLSEFDNKRLGAWKNELIKDKKTGTSYEVIDYCCPAPKVHMMYYKDDVDYKIDPELIKMLMHCKEGCDIDNDILCCRHSNDIEITSVLVCDKCDKLKHREHICESKKWKGINHDAKKQINFEDYVNLVKNSDIEKSVKIEDMFKIYKDHRKTKKSVTENALDASAIGNDFDVECQSGVHNDECWGIKTIEMTKKLTGKNTKRTSWIHDGRYDSMSLNIDFIQSNIDGSKVQLEDDMIVRKNKFYDTLDCFEFILKQDDSNIVHRGLKNSIKPAYISGLYVDAYCESEKLVINYKECNKQCCNVCNSKQAISKESYKNSDLFKYKKLDHVNKMYIDKNRTLISKGYTVIDYWNVCGTWNVNNDKITSKVGSVKKIDDIKIFKSVKCNVYVPKV